MSRESIVMLLGLVVLFAPSVGIPSDWKMYIMPITGGLLIVLGYSLRRSMYMRALDKGNGERGNDAFSEHNGTRANADVPPEDTA